MRRALVLVLVAACVPQEPVRAPEVVLPLAAPRAVATASSAGTGVGSPIAEPQADEPFTGDYTSSYGDVGLEQNGSDVTATYPNGTMSCVARGPSLECTWDEGGTVGRAVLTRQPSGNIVGTWGYGSSDTDGGAWTLEPK